MSEGSTVSGSFTIGKYLLFWNKILMRNHKCRQRNSSLAFLILIILIIVNKSLEHDYICLQQYNG